MSFLPRNNLFPNTDSTFSKLFVKRGDGNKEDNRYFAPDL